MTRAPIFERGGRARIPGGRWLQGLALAALLPSCDATPTAKLEVTLSMRDGDGVALDCAAVGAEEIELLLFLGAEDALPYDRLVWPCALGRHVARVDRGSYLRAEARLVGVGGGTVRLCGAEGTVEARVAFGALEVTEGETAALSLSLVGAPGSCPVPAPAPNR